MQGSMGPLHETLSTHVNPDHRLYEGHINIVDLIERERGRGNIKERVQTFRNMTELQAYTKSTGKIFRNTFDQEDGNIVLRHLLYKIFPAMLHAKVAENFGNIRMRPRLAWRRRLQLASVSISVKQINCGVHRGSFTVVAASGLLHKNGISRMT